MSRSSRGIDKTVNGNSCRIDDPIYTVPEQVAMISHDPVTEIQAAYHYLHDALGSVIGLVNSVGTLVERYTYDPYGKVFIEKWQTDGQGGGQWLASAEPNSGMPYSSVGNPLLWTGHRYDAAVGLYHTLFRFYDPTLGRWLQRDPIEYTAGSINLYQYVNGNPIRFTDALGLCSAGDNACSDECNEGVQRFGNDMPVELREKCAKKCSEMCEKAKDGWGESWTEGRARAAARAFWMANPDCGHTARERVRRASAKKSFRESAEGIQEEVDERGNKLGKGDKWKHFMVSCRIASELPGGFVAILPAGIAKEVADNWPSGDNQNSPGGIADSILDMMANTVGWVQSVTVALTGESCEEIAQKIGFK